MKEIFDKLKHSPIHNYILPGLTSWVLKPAGDGHGMIRMFEASRETQEFITPHSHRYGLHCEVLAGWVENTIWKNSELVGASNNSDEWMLCSLKYAGNPGEYTQTPGPIRRYAKETRRYAAGSSYDLNHSQIHSVRFSRGAVVVITETAQRTDTTQILLPVAYGKAVPTFKVESWMYKP